jgi:hypothetical protein
MLLNRQAIQEDKYFDLLTAAILDRDQPRTTELFFGMTRDGHSIGDALSVVTAAEAPFVQVPGHINVRDGQITLINSAGGLPVSGRSAQPEDHDLDLRGVRSQFDPHARSPASRDGAAAGRLAEDAGRARLLCSFRERLDLPLSPNSAPTEQGGEAHGPCLQRHRSRSHILEPPTLWNDYMDSGFRDRAPKARH